MIVRESISFERYRDPKTALFGVFHKRDFKLEKEFMDFIAQNVKEIIDVTKFEHGHIIGKTKGNQTKSVWCYSLANKELENYIAEYITVNGKIPELFISNLYTAIKRNNIKNLIEESISFERYRDPKKALGLDSYLGAMLRIPNWYLRSHGSQMYSGSQSTGYHDFEVVNANKISNSIKVDLEYTFINGEKIIEYGLKLSTEDFEKFRIENVKESISFERYREPKEALGLKSEPEIIEQMENIYYIFQIYDFIYVLANETTWSLYYRGHAPHWKSFARELVTKHIYIAGNNIEDYNFSYIKNELIEKVKKIIKEDVKERMKKDLTESKRYIK